MNNGNKDFKKRDTKRMLDELCNAGIREKELTEAIGCSRWALTLWRNEEHEPLDETYEAVKAAYEQFEPVLRTPTPEMIKRLKERGVVVHKALKTRQSVVEAWQRGKSFPQIHNRLKLVELYKKHVRNSRRAA